MSVVRVENKTKNYTRLDNAVLNNGEISYQALGLLVRLLSKPPAWIVQVTEMVRGKNGVTEIYRILTELQIAGYVVKNVGRNARGRITFTDYTVYEKPQTADPDTVSKLTQMCEKRRAKKRANNHKRNSQPHVAEPEMMKPDLAEPAPIKERAETKERVDKGKPPAPLQAKGGEASSTLPGKRNGEVDAGPSLDPDAAKPRVAALETPLERFNYSRWLQSEEAGMAQKLEALFPRDVPFAINQDAARKFHQRCRTGLLSPTVIDLLVQFYPECYIDPDHETPGSLDTLLRKDVLPHVIDACRDAVRQEIAIIRSDSDEVYEEQRIVQEFLSAGKSVTPETDMVEETHMRPSNVVAYFFAGYSRGAPRLLEAARLHRQKIIAELERTKAWSQVTMSPGW